MVLCLLKRAAWRVLYWDGPDERGTLVGTSLLFFSIERTLKGHFGRALNYISFYFSRHAGWVSQKAFYCILCIGMAPGGHFTTICPLKGPSRERNMHRIGFVDDQHHIPAIEFALFIYLLLSTWQLQHNYGILLTRPQHFKQPAIRAPH